MGARALEGVRVLDMSDATAQYCGKLFADLGADVILIEPPGGSPARRIGPFIDDTPGPDSSIPFLYENTNKRSIVIDLDAAHDRDLLRQLVRSADILIDTSPPGQLASLGLGHSALRGLRPDLVQISITPFGQTGPRAHWRADDLVLLGLGGLAQLGGYPDGPPQVAYGEQAYHAAASFAAVAGMAALLRAEAGGGGEFIDVSMHEATVMALENAAQFFDLEGVVRPRASGHRVIAGQLPCKDGYVYVMAGGVSGAKSWVNVVSWLNAEKVPEAETLADPIWDDTAWRNSDKAKREFERIFAGWSMGLTRAEIEASARKHRIPMAIVATPADVLASEQLKHRGFFVSIDHLATGRTLKMPGAPYMLSRTPVLVERTAPLLDADRDAILEETALCLRA